MVITEGELGGGDGGGIATGQEMGWARLELTGGGRFLDINQVFGAPLLEVRIGGETGLDVLVAVEFVLHQIEGEHAPGPEPTGLNHLAREVVHQAGFGGQNEVAVVENLVAGRA